MKRKISLNLDDDVLSEFERMAEKQGRSVSRLVNDVLKGGLESRSEMLRELDKVNLVDLVSNLMKAVKPGKR